MMIRIGKKNYEIESGEKGEHRLAALLVDEIIRSCSGGGFGGTSPNDFDENSYPMYVLDHLDC